MTMSLIHFSNAIDRAKVKKENHTKLLEPASINVACDTLIFAYEHINLVEEQLSVAQELSDEWKAQAKRHQRQIDALLDVVCVVGSSRDKILKLIADIK